MNARSKPAQDAPFLCVNDVAERLSVSSKTVRRHIDEGHLIAHRIGVQLRISEADLELFLQARRGLKQMSIPGHRSTSKSTT